MYRRMALAICVIGAGTLSASEPVAITQVRDRLDFTIDSQLVASYHTAATQLKPYLWPVRAPNGLAVTRAWPLEPAKPGESTDHVHQKSAWFTFGDVIPDATAGSPQLRGVDFWIEVPPRGKIVCREIQQPANGRVVTRNQWQALDGKVILEEVRTLSVHDFGSGWLLAVTTELGASDSGITFGDTKEGAFGARVHDQLRTEVAKGKPGPSVNRITNSNGGQGESECWGRLADWCDYSGTIDGKPVGIALFDDSRNKYRSCWHVRGYGLIAANPFGREKSGFPAMKGRTDRVKLEKGQFLKLRYGIFTHTGDATDGKVAEAYRRFRELPY